MALACVCMEIQSVSNMIMQLAVSCGKHQWRSSVVILVGSSGKAFSSNCIVASQIQTSALEAVLDAVSLAVLAAALAAVVQSSGEISHVNRISSVSSSSSSSSSNRNISSSGGQQWWSVTAVPVVAVVTVLVASGVAVAAAVAADAESRQADH